MIVVMEDLFIVAVAFAVGVALGCAVLRAIVCVVIMAAIG